MENRQTEPVAFPDDTELAALRAWYTESVARYLGVHKPSETSARGVHGRTGARWLRSRRAVTGPIWQRHSVSDQQIRSTPLRVRSRICAVCRCVDKYVARRLRIWLMHKRGNQERRIVNTSTVSCKTLGLIRLQTLVANRANAKVSGSEREPDAGNPHVRFRLYRAAHSAVAQVAAEMRPRTTRVRDGLSPLRSYRGLVHRARPVENPSYCEKQALAS
jgi:hypothetical protein